MNRNLLEKGFIPEEICTHLPNGFEDVEEISSSLHKILANNQISNVISEIDQEKDISSLSRSSRKITETFLTSWRYDRFFVSSKNYR